ncbi:MAG: rRNA pseudouridine synthase [Planctomycetes bacterium]|nr:rRNA pseudouridine synthase [Planctomycetota bacterium]
MSRARESEPRRRGLERILSKLGVCSRSEARRLIQEGRVKVNRVVIVDPEAWFDPERDEIQVDGRAVRAAEKLYYALHKPRGYITSRTDPNERLTVYALIESIGAWVVPVGRLDLDTSGLLLFTNDTQFADLVSSPASHVEKTYRVECSPRLDDAALQRLARGVELADGPTRPARVAEHTHRGPVSRFEITITEGRNRQVRRMVKEVGAKVEKLARIAIGPVQLGDLAAGTVRPLTGAEVRALIAAGQRAASTQRRPAT